MTHIVFPPVEVADEGGLLGIGGTPTTENLLEAYKRGIFPWPWSEDYLAWFAPEKRGILYFQDLHIPRSLKKAIRSSYFSISVDTSFEEVIEQCRMAKNRKNQHGTWITEDLLQGYAELHKGGHAHSFEVRVEGRLVGGLYGVGIGGYFSGESMFYLEANASKVALIAAIHYLKQHGVKWMDCQVLTGLTETFGAKEVTRELFTELLCEALTRPTPPWEPGDLSLDY